MFDRVDHVGIAVAQLEEALALYGDTFGMQLVHREVLSEQGVEAALFDVGESHVELIAPLAPDSSVGRFISSRGPGLHHVAYGVSDIDEALASLRARDVALIDTTPRTGIRSSRVAFLHPRGTGGVLTEIVEAAHP